MLLQIQIHGAKATINTSEVHLDVLSSLFFSLPLLNGEPLVLHDVASATILPLYLVLFILLFSLWELFVGRFCDGGEKGSFCGVCHSSQERWFLSAIVNLCVNYIGLCMYIHIRCFLECVACLHGTCMAIVFFLLSLVWNQIFMDKTMWL